MLYIFSIYEVGSVGKMGSKTRAGNFETENRKGIQVCSIKGPRPFSRKDDVEIIHFNEFLKSCIQRESNFNKPWHKASLG